MERIPRQFYTTRVQRGGRSAGSQRRVERCRVGRRLSFRHTLRNWIAKHRGGKALNSGARTVTDLEAEVSRLRKELSEPRLDKEILKMAMAYLAKEPRGRYAMIEQLRKNKVLLSSRYAES